MLLVSRRSRVAVFVPVLFTVLGGAFVVPAVDALATHVTLGGCFRLAVSSGILLFALSEVRLVFALEGGVRIRSLFRRADFDARACSFTVTVVHSGRGGATYDVYAGDGDASGRAKVSFHFTKAGAGRAVRRLATGVLELGVDAAHAEATAVVETLRHAERANAALTRAYMARRSPRMKLLPWLAVGAMVVVAIVTALASRC